MKRASQKDARRTYLKIMKYVRDTLLKESDMYAQLASHPEADSRDCMIKSLAFKVAANMVSTHSGIVEGE